jgi:hypothetical protein
MPHALRMNCACFRAIGGLLWDVPHSKNVDRLATEHGLRPRDGRGRPRTAVSAGRVAEDVAGAISTEPDCRRQRSDGRTRPERQPRRATRSRACRRSARPKPPAAPAPAIDLAALGQVHAATKGGRRLALRPIQGRHDAVRTRDSAEAKRGSTGSAVTHPGCPERATALVANQQRDLSSQEECGARLQARAARLAHHPGDPAVLRTRPTR